MADEENLQVGGRAVHELRVVDLKKELEKRGLPKSGSKKELVERLKAQLLLEKCREMPVDEDDNVPNIATDEETSENEVIKEYMAERRRMFEQQKEARKKMEEEERRLSESAQESQVEQEEEPKPEPQSEPEPEPANHKEAVQEDDAAENEPDEPQVAREAEEPMVVDNKETEEKVELQEPLENHQEEKENKKDDLPEVPENVPEGDEEPPAKKGRKSRSRSSSRSKSRSSSSESRSRSRSPPPPKKRLSSSSASSRSASESKSRSRSRSRSRKESRSRSGSRSRSSSSSSDSESDHEDKPKIKGTVAVTPKVKEVARDDSYYTAPEDLSRDESNMEDSSKDVGQEETMETSEVDKQDKDEESTGPAQPERQISMESSGGAAGKPARKRRWGSTRVPAKKNTFNISTDSLKGLIPEIKPSAISKEPLPDLGNGNDKEESEEEDEAFDKKDLKIQRTVIQDVKDEVMEQEAGETKTEAPPPPATEADQETDKSAAKIIRRVSRQTSGVMADEPQAARRSPSPARNPVSCIIHVRNLTRPYTLPQLKEVLGNLGTLVDEGFWIDKIKSHCYATYESEEHAQAARASLHGSRWPLSNPKLLRVDYATKDELEHHRNAELAPSMIKRKIEQDVKSEEADKGVREVRVKEDARPQQHVREWDRQKLRQSRSRSRDRERGRDRDRERRRSERSTERARSNERRLQERSRGREKERKGTEKKEEDDEPPAKLLDDLFCKTKATPCIYWLPLTDEQIVEKARELEKLNEERERRRKMREKAEEARRKREREDRRKQVQQQQQRTRDRSREHARQRSRSGSRSRRRR